MMTIIRKHGWQCPFHPFQILGIVIYCFLVVVFFVFLAFFLGSRAAEITLIVIYSISAVLVMLLFIRCTAIDPTDKSRFKKKGGENPKRRRTLNFRFITKQIVVRYLRRMERKILKSFIRRKYLNPVNSSTHLEPFIPFPLIHDDEATFPNPLDEEMSFCSHCDFEVRKHSKHCRTCNRCVEGFDHHCRWLNNCVGKKNYSTFFFLMVFILLMLLVEGGAAIVVFVRCFTDKNGIETELKRSFHADFPREVLATIAILLALMIAYSTAAMGQLFLFHVLLIRKGMRTYDYILAMKEKNQSDSFDEDTDFSSDSDCESPDRRDSEVEKRLSVKIESSRQCKEEYRVGIKPWQLLKLSTEEALVSTGKARERMLKQKISMLEATLRPPPIDTKCSNMRSPGKLSSPRRRHSGSPTLFAGIMASPNRYDGNTLDFKLTEVTRDIETQISRQSCLYAVKKDVSDE